ncbi:hypothetical protein [Paenibacillus pini]|uniref:Uncharacterized protein n=1 Tax=Paenibacillus pini JCM 16418 TaxID=1236976 RepID=W7YM76_9BACL|nr:hypothetical protein [Paenibacillus pini]GAF08693.1 hypothetical protein JCM16418_2782 [Paenibacillus pini JCM 16418]
MSILSLHSAPHTNVDSRYVQALDLEVVNSGNDSYEMLIGMYGERGLYDTHLISLDPGVKVSISDIQTAYMPFQLVLVTNTNHAEHTEVMVRLKHNGTLLAVYTRRDMTESV